jgi:hypothetical protein
LFGAPIAHPIDTKNVTNKFSGAATALSVASLQDAVTKFRQFVDADGEPIMVEGFELVVPPALEITALQILQSQLLLAAGGDGQANAKLQIQPNKNVLSAMNITLHVNPYLPIIDTSGEQGQDVVPVRQAVERRGCADELPARSRSSGDRHEEPEQVGSRRWHHQPAGRRL